MKEGTEEEKEETTHLEDVEIFKRTLDGRVSREIDQQRDRL